MTESVPAGVQVVGGPELALTLIVSRMRLSGGNVSHQVLCRWDSLSPAEEVAMLRYARDSLEKALAQSQSGIVTAPRGPLLVK